MSVYSISSINVKDWDAYAEYMKLVPAVIKKYGGKYLVRGCLLYTSPSPRD